MFFTRPKVNRAIYQHRLADAARINGGAEEFAFEMYETLPVIMYTNPGRMAGELEVYQKPIIVLAPVGAPNDVYLGVLDRAQNYVTVEPPQPVVQE